MFKLKRISFLSLAGFALTREDWLLILSIAITVLSMIMDYIKDRRD